MEDVISERRKKKLVYNRYIFWRDGQSSDGKIYRIYRIIWKFIEALRKMQNINKNKIEALCAQGPPAKRRKYKDLDARLKTIVEDFANRDILDFLRGIAHNLQFVQ